MGGVKGKTFLKCSMESLKYSVDSTFEKAWILGMDFHKKNKYPTKKAEKLRMKIFDFNKTHISKLKHRFTVFM